MSFFCRLSGRHYWCTPHRSADKRLIQVCYECGAERPASELVDDVASERFNQRLASAKSQLADATRRATAEPARVLDRVAAEGGGRALALVK
ncbi:MAG TPA: hypothetical protein VLE20_14180 [Blastocatellia bacterium]|jgi:hypothetical protein|nr:hypothetical protein [Blastocatellia bacterium]